MPPTKPLSVILIAALSPNNGLGLAGGLPWSLSKEMAYFRKATTHAPNATKNIVIMGRNTWESIPPRFRPLKGRVNYVVSRAAGSKEREKELGIDADKDSFLVASLQAALDRIQAQQQQQAGRVFLIGGSQLYAQAMKELAAHSSSSSSLAKLDCLLITRIVSPHFDCDVFLPEFRTRQQVQDDGELAQEAASSTAEQSRPLDVAQWEKRPSSELRDWLGDSDIEGVGAGVVEEKGVRYEFQMWTPAATR